MAAEPVPPAARGDSRPAPGGRSAGVARLMLVALSVLWGVSWPVMKIALIDIPPFSMRVGATALGAATLVVFTVARRRSLRLPTRKAWAHVAVASLLNMVGFGLLNAFAQLSASTSRVTVLVYSMPVWAALLARPVLGERLTPVRGVALMLCLAGLAVLMGPHLASGEPGGMLLAAGSGLSWAGGTVYMKWARIEGDQFAVTTWQLVIALVVIVAFLPLFEDTLHLWPAPWGALSALAYTGILAVGVAYILWFDIVNRLPATTAALGVLSVPALGVVTSMLMLGERPTLIDAIGFALILAASACVLILSGPRAKA